MFCLSKPVKVAYVPSEASVQSGHPGSLLHYVYGYLILFLPLMKIVVCSLICLYILVALIIHRASYAKNISVKLQLFSYPSLNICFGCSKTFEYPQHMFWLKTKKIIFSYALLSGGLIIAKQF